MAKTIRQPKQMSAKQQDDSFASVAKRLECDPSEDNFDRALRKIAKQPPKPAGGH